MPSRNAVKEYASHSYFHIYNRGVAKQPIFLDESDKNYFLKIIARLLDPTNTDKRYDGVSYVKFNDSIELLCYCLMENHFHMLIYVNEEHEAIKVFMKSLSTAYAMYFNHRHKRVGALFQGVYKASRVSNESYLTHISRYIHLNPRNYQSYTYSSLKNYYISEPPAWLKPQKIKNLFHNKKEYYDFLADYNGSLAILDELKVELANSSLIYPSKRHRS